MSAHQGRILVESQAGRQLGSKERMTRMKKEEDSVRPSEKGAVFTTIVGGRPPGSGTDVGRIPRGIEVLIKKASVDEAFRAILLARRAEAAGEIALELADAEKAMLGSIPAAQLETIISQTKVKPQNRRVFLGKVAAAMLAAVGVGAAGCENEPPTRGVQPDKPPTTKGVRPDRPEGKSSEEQPEIMVSTGIRVESEPNQPADEKAGTSKDESEETPMITRGIQPDRPPTYTLGISPDRPPTQKE